MPTVFPNTVKSRPVDTVPQTVPRQPVKMCRRMIHGSSQASMDLRSKMLDRSAGGAGVVGWVSV
jgi:hypothetical protein